MKRLLIVFYLFTINLQLFAGLGNSLKGTIITTSGEKMIGIVAPYTNNSGNITSVFFRNKDQKDFTLVNAGQIVSFDWGSEKFFKMNLDKKLRYIINEQDSLLFIKLIIDGDKKLLSYTNANQNTYFFICLNGDYVLLNNHTYYSDFRMQLKNYLGIENFEILRDVLYNEVSISNLFYSVNKSDIHHLLPLKDRGGICLMGKYFNVQFERTNYSTIGSIINEKYFTGYGVGFYYDFMLNDPSNRWQMHNEIVYNNYYYKNTDLPYQKLKIMLDYFELKNMFRYYFSNMKQKQFVTFGITNGFLVSNYNQFVSYGTTYNNYLDDSVKKHEFGLNAGIGYRTNFFTCEMRYELGNGLTDFFSYRSITKRFELILSVGL